MISYYKKGYYRPQFERESFIDLCGEWDFLFDDNNEGEEKRYFSNFPSTSKKIIVPFTYETIASNVHDEIVHNVVWYKRALLISKLDNQRLIINFEGSDYLTKVWVNGHLVGNHEGYTSRFSFDVTDYVNEDGNNEIVVKCEDSLDSTQPRGKQRWLNNSYGCWYVQTTGLYKPVWCEVVSKNRLNSVKITPNFESEDVTFEYEFLNVVDNLEVEALVTFDGVIVNKNRQLIKRYKTINTLDLRCNAFDFKTRIWNFENPNLYEVRFRVFENDKLIDEVNSYFGFRKISVDETGIKLNNNPLYQKLILAQNYWAESGLTAPNEEAFIHDINMTKAAGFNGVRIHQKTEDERFLFYCDVMGLLVWGEFPAAYEYSDDAVEKLTNEWMSVVRQYYNHPSIITWVPFNESWGIPNIYDSEAQQNFTKGIYFLTKTFDTMRPVITNDGWEHTISDILTLHDYDGCGAKMKEKYTTLLEGVLNNSVAHGGYKFAFAKNYEYYGQPIIISEYGGVAYDHSDGWGYNEKVTTEEALVAKYKELTDAIKFNKRICGYCYTQLTDTYQEVNGLLDFNHKPKIDLSKIKKINDSIWED
jgi:beta-galactosidase/beta-glucuronidase